MKVVQEIEVEQIISAEIKRLQDDDWYRHPVQIWYPKPDGGMEATSSQVILTELIRVLKEVKGKVNQRGYETKPGAK